MKPFTHPYSLVFCFLLISCFGGPPPETIDVESSVLEGTKWQLIDRYDLDATIEFDPYMTKLSGNNGCNDFTADIILKNYFIEFTNFTNTERYCEDLNNDDRNFLIGLSKVRDFTITKNRLSLRTIGITEIGGKKASTLNFNRIEK